MNEKNLEVLSILKRHLFGQEGENKNVTPVQAGPTVQVKFKPKAKILGPEESILERDSKLVQSPTENGAAKSKKTHKRKTKKTLNLKLPPSSSGSKYVLISDLVTEKKTISKPAQLGVLTNTVNDFKPKFDSTHIFNTPEWFCLGHNLQHPNRQSVTLRPTLVRVGIDFGTAFTKAAVKIGLDTVIIDWSPLTGKADLNSRNLLPGVVAKTPDGHYCWHDFSDNTLITNLKLPLLHESNLEHCPVASIAYLALVIRYVRAAIYKHPEFAVKLASSYIRWEFNIGCASEPHDKIPIVKRMERVALVAWHLAASNELSDESIKSFWNTNLGLAGLEGLPQVVPEFVAQIASYLTSPQLKEGLHMLVDVGAATLDVATFNVVKNNEEFSIDIPIFFSKVVNLGTHFFNLHRHVRFKLPKSWDDTLPVQRFDDFAKEIGLINPLLSVQMTIFQRR